MNEEKIVISKKWLYLGFSVILIVIIFLAFALIKGNYKVKLSTEGAEFTPVNIGKDTTHQVVPPIQKPEQSTVSTQKVSTKRKATVKSGDTTVTVENQPAIINTGTNNGVMGNGNTINVQTKELQRHLDNASKAKLLSLIDQVIKQNNLNPDHCIQVSTANRTPESEKYAGEIVDFLEVNNYNVYSDVGVVMIPSKVKGVNVQPTIKRKCIDIWVGNE